MNKKVVASITIALALAAGSGQAYAATVLNSNIIGLIKSGITGIQGAYFTKTDSDVAEISGKYTGQISQIVEEARTNAVNQLEANQRQQVARADQELSSYVNEMKQQVHNQINQEVQAVNQQVNNKVDQAIEDAKKEIEKQFEKQIYDLLK